MAENEYKYKITVKEDGTLAFQKLNEGGDKFHQTSKKVQGAATEMGESFKRLKETVLATVGVFEAFHFAGESQEYYLGVKRANAEIQASLESTKGAAGETNDALEKSADSLFHHSEFAKDNIKNMQAVLLTFPDVTKATFDTAQTAIADMAAKLGGKGADLKETAIQIGKALQDPAHGMMALRREGVNFTKDQVEMVKGMVAAGHATQAQTFILNELNKEFGGSASAALKAGGASEQMGKTTEDLKETLGELVDELETDFLPIATKVMEGFQGMVKWAGQHKNMIEGVIKVAGGLVAIYLVWQTTVKATAAYNTLAALANAALGTSLATTTVATEAATASMEALDVAMDANPIGLMVTAVAALAAGFWALANAEDSANDSYAKGIANTGTSIFQNANKGTRENLLNANLKQTQEDYDKIQAYSDMLKMNPDAGAKSRLSKYTEQQLEDISSHIDDIKQDYKEQTMLGSNYLKVINSSNSKPVTKPKSDTGAKTLNTTDSKGEHQIINTWNIKEFGKTDVHTNTIEMAAEKIGAMFQDLLMQVVMNAQIASGQ